MIGQKFNYLTILSFSHYDKHHRKHFLCKCDCGNEKTIQISLLKSGNTKSCGCYAKSVRGILSRLPDNAGVINHLILQYKRHAKNRNIDFNLSFEQFKNIISQNCEYCGSPPSNNKITKNCSGFLYSGIDRVNSNIGYNVSNCVPSCKTCNLAKRDLTKEDFLSWISRVFIYNSQKRKIA